MFFCRWSGRVGIVFVLSVKNGGARQGRTVMIFQQNYIKLIFNNNTLSVLALPPKRKPDTPAEEAKKAAFYYKKHRRIILCMSGGLDSEIMAESFLKAGAPFSVSIWRYKNLNTYDIKHAVSFCERHGLNYEIEECDPELFYEKFLHIHYGIKYLCNSPQIAVHLYFIEKLAKKNPSSALFLPWEPPSFYYDSVRKTMLPRILINSRYLAYYRAFHLNKIAGTPYFLICSSALLYSFLRLPAVRFIMNQNINMKRKISYKIKTEIYKQGGFSAKPRKGKFTGFDKMKTALFKQYGMDYDRAFRHPLENLTPSPRKKELYVVPVWEDAGRGKAFLRISPTQNHQPAKPIFEKT